jgi:hypothetical protein
MNKCKVFYIFLFFQPANRRKGEKAHEAWQSKTKNEGIPSA